MARHGTVVLKFTNFVSRKFNDHFLIERGCLFDPVLINIEIVRPFDVGHFDTDNISLFVTTASSVVLVNIKPMTATTTITPTIIFPICNALRVRIASVVYTFLKPTKLSFRACRGIFVPYFALQSILGCDPSTRGLGRDDKRKFQNYI